ncbi:MAG: hypothetical protein HY088_03275 [Ignavibacteriales bacterium]|nr:hypothetical protein [Ignavibacteriales bacterium]
MFIKRNVVLGWLVLAIVAAPVLARQSATNTVEIGRWKNYTDMKTIRSAAVLHDSLWVATSGGLLLYNTSSRTFTKFTNSEGLSSNDLSAVAIDGTGKIWTGAADGSLNIYDPGTKQWKENRGIKDSERIQKGVRSFFVQNDSLFVGTDFGISVFIISRSEFRDTYASFGFPSQAKVNDIVVYKNRIWAATDLGVATALLSATNLSSPTSWTTYGTNEGLPSKNTTSITVFRDTIVVGTVDGAAIFSNTSFQPLPQLSSKSIVDMVPRSNDLLIAWNTAEGFSYASVASVSGSLGALTSNTEGQASMLAVQTTPSNVWVGTVLRGMTKWNGTAWEYVVPNGPYANLFSSVAVDEQGRVWAASGISDRGRGFYRFDPSKPEDAQWKNFSASNNPSMQRDDYYKISLGANNSVWVSSWGYGLVEVVGDSIRRHLDDSTIPAFSPSVSNSHFVVMGGVAPDSKGNTWFATRTAIDGKHLTRVASDGSVQYVNSPSQGMFTNMVVDRNNTKWLANAEPFNKPVGVGLYYFNEDTLVAGTKFTGGWGAMTQTDGLPSSGVNDVILSLAVDLEGQICVGTDVGMMIITDPRNPKVSTSRIISFPLRLQSIQAIAVDALNNKWVGTKDGVIVVNADASQVVGQYNVLSTNGRLVDNDVRSIAIDQKRGIVYIGTEKGLSSLEIQPVRVLRNFTSLEFGPNPYIIPNASQLMIRNLIAETTIKILSVNGALISEFKAQGGGRAFWDGRDLTGQFVSSGVYFVVAFAENGNQINTGKIAVIRR